MLSLVFLLLSGCSLSPLVNGSVMDYFQVTDLAANRIILLNILRAMDGAPLHFSELSLVRGQLTASTNTSVTFPFGPLLHATSPRQLAGFGGTVSSAPSFDVGSLDTQDFTKGVMTQITPATVNFFLDEGIDYRLVWLLLVSGVRTAGNQETILNAPESSRQICYAQKNLPLNAPLPAHYTIIGPGDVCAGTAELEFFGFLRELNSIHRVYAKTVEGSARTIGAPFALDMRSELRALAGMDPAKYRMEKLASGQYQLEMAERPETTVLCEEPLDGGSPRVLSVLQDESIGKPVSANSCVVGVSQPGASPASQVTIGTSPGTVQLTLRSTLEVIQFLGRVLAFQIEQTRMSGHARCVTLDFEGRAPYCNGDILFDLRHNESAAAIGLDYDSQYWAVPQSPSCTATSPSCDHTLETMAMISLLLNQNKSAKDIPSTPAFEAVP
jgi:hypothetical protein